jgi:Cu(I)/Ag(I) efflux system membrane fusion protein
MKEKMKCRTGDFSIVIRWMVCSCIAMLLLSCNTQENSHRDDDHVRMHHVSPEKAAVAHDVYTCPMHPEVVKDTPGACPICGMDLVKREESAGPDTVRVTEMPMDASQDSIISNIATVHPSFKMIFPKIKMSGSIAYDARRIYSIASRVEGRIEKLHVNFIFQKVRKGDPLLEISSHSLLVAQQEYLYLKKNDPESPLLQASENKLLLLGVTRQQINKLSDGKHVHPAVTIYSPVSGYVIENNENVAGNNLSLPVDKMNADGMGGDMTSGGAGPFPVKQGAYINKGQSVFRIVNTDKVWAVFEVFAGEGSLIKKGQPVRILLESSDTMLEGKVDFMEPAYNKASQTSRLRVYLNNENEKLKTGNFITGEIDVNPVKTFVIPQTAVCDLGTRKVVFVKKNNGYETREVTTGILAGNDIEIRQGLSASEEVAAHAQFMVDSESLIQLNK